MRLILSLKAEKDMAYDQKYFGKAQGLIYGLLKGGPYDKLHDKKGFKFFCFSNVFPTKKDEPIKEGSVKSFIISSPDRNFISALSDAVPVGTKIEIGEMQFSLVGKKTVQPKLTGDCRIKIMTPLILRIPKRMYAEYGIENNYNYTYWRPQTDVNAFLKQLSDNVYKKYNEFHKTDVKEDYIFQQFMFSGSHPIHPIIDQTEQTMIGSYWTFIFQGLGQDHRRLLEFALDCGFGELNSMGFGFGNDV